METDTADATPTWTAEGPTTIPIMEFRVLSGEQARELLRSYELVGGK